MAVRGRGRGTQCRGSNQHVTAPHVRKPAALPPTVSSSTTVTGTGVTEMLLNALSEDATVAVIWTDLLPSTMLLSTAATANVWFVPQLVLVKVSDDGAAVA